MAIVVSRQNAYHNSQTRSMEYVLNKIKTLSFLSLTCQSAPLDYEKKKFLCFTVSHTHLP